MANLSFYAVCPFGLEELLAGEISACGAERIRAARGGVSFSGSAATAMAVCLNSRLASRVLMKVAEASYWDTRDIYEMAADTPWEKWFGPDLTIKVSANGQRCPLESIDFAVLRIKDGICDRFRDLAGRRPDVERYNPDVRIAAFLTYDTCTFYLDLAGEALFKRGWRLTHGEAPLKENLAAGLLMLSGWDPSQTLIDPFCGSGTIGIEAAQMAAGMAPGLNRRFAFEKLEGFDVDLWAEMKEDARAAVNRHVRIRIAGSDISSLVVEKAEENARRAGLGDMLDDGRLTFRQGDAREACPEEGMAPGLLIANPPYGEQSNPKSASIQSMMKHVADNLKANFAGSTARSRSRCASRRRARQFSSTDRLNAASSALTWLRAATAESRAKRRTNKSLRSPRNRAPVHSMGALFFEREKNPRNRNRGDFSCLSAGAFRLVLANQQFLNTSGLAGAVTQVVELGTADIAVALHFDGSDRRGVELERTFNAFAGRDLADDEGRVETAVAAGDHDAFEGLNALAGTFNDVDVHDNRVTGAERGDRLASGDAGHFFLFENLNQIHFFLQNHRHAAVFEGAEPTAERMAKLIQNLTSSRWRATTCGPHRSTCQKNPRF